MPFQQPQMFHIRLGKNFIDQQATRIGTPVDLLTAKELRKFHLSNLIFRKRLIIFESRNP